jgi:tryptophanyl-tRNA synthetase
LALSQKQHLELTRDIAAAVNRKVNCPAQTVLPQFTSFI